MGVRSENGSVYNASDVGVAMLHYNSRVKEIIFARILRSDSESVMKLILSTLFSSINFAHTVVKLGVSI